MNAAIDYEIVEERSPARTITLSRGVADDLGTVRAQETHSLESMAEIVRTAERRPSPMTFAKYEATPKDQRGAVKRSGWYTPATFKDNRRTIANIVAVHAINLDVDKEASRENLVAALDKIGCDYITFNSTSHGVGGKQAWRVCIPLDQPITGTPEQIRQRYKEVWSWFASHVPGVDRGASDCSRLNYWPFALSGAPERAILTKSEGTFFDASTVTPEPAEKKSSDGSIQHTDAPPLDANTLADLKSALSFKPLQEWASDNESWSEVGYSLLKLGAVGYELWLNFSRAAPNYQPGAPEKWWSDHRTQDARSDHRHIFTLAHERGWEPSRISSASDFGDPSKAPSPVPQATSQVVASADAAPKLITLTLRTLRDDLYTKAPPPRPKTLGGYLPKGAASKFGGPGGFGKSMVALYGAFCVATGHNFCGQPCTPGVAVYLSAEDDYEEFERRMHNIMHALYPDGLPDEVRGLLRKHLRVIDLVESGTDALLTQMDRRGKVVITPFVDHVANVLAGVSPELVFFDTQSRFHGGPENDNTAGAVFIRALECVAKKTGAGVNALSHVGKGKDMDTSQYDRGASSLTDNSRAAMKLMLPPPNFKDKLADPRQIEAVERENILRLVHAKNSYGRRYDEVYFERNPDTGVLLPVLLSYKSLNGPSPFPPTASDHLSYLLSELAKAPDDPEQEFREISRGELKRDWKKWCGPTSSREDAEAAFLTAVNANQLVFSRKVSNASWYRLAPKPTDPTSAAGGSDLY